LFIDKFNQLFQHLDNLPNQKAIDDIEIDSNGNTFNHRTEVVDLDSDEVGIIIV